MKITAFAAFASLCVAGPAFAAGDAAAGEKVFKKCKSCHMIVDASGTAIQKGGKSGPNLHGLNGRKLGSVSGFKYSKGLKALGDTGATWNEGDFVAWLENPSNFLSDKLGKKERSKMSFRLKKAKDAQNLWAYLVSVGG